MEKYPSSFSRLAFLDWMERNAVPRRAKLYKETRTEQAETRQKANGAQRPSHKMPNATNIPPAGCLTNPTGDQVFNSKSFSETCSEYVLKLSTQDQRDVDKALRLFKGQGLCLTCPYQADSFCRAISGP